MTPPSNGPVAATDTRFRSIPARFEATAQRLHDRAAYHVRTPQGWQATSWSSYAQQVQSAARSLLALGVKPGDAVCILGFNRPEWTTLNMATLMIGGVAVGIYWSSAANEVAYIVEHSGCRVLLLENAAQWRKVANHPDVLARLSAVVLMDAQDTPAADGSGNGLPAPLMPWAGFLALGSSSQEAQRQQRMAQLADAAVCTLIYTSGTTGHPKAVKLTHGNLSWTSAALSAAFGVGPDDRLISYLPLAHIAEQLGSIHNHALAGYQLYFARSLESLGEHLAEVHPTVFFGVPRVWEKMQAAVVAKINTATGPRATLAQWALHVGRAWHACTLAGQPPGPWLSLQKALAQRLVHAKIKRALGFDRARILISGAAPISVDSLKFFTGLDLLIGEVYGQSEDCGPTAISLPGFIHFGSVGKPLPGAEVRIAPDGEILVRGPHVFAGYKARDDDTASALRDGWLHSGDLGHMDAQGFIYVTGRKKDILITSGGKNISPANIEADLMNQALIEHAVVVGEGRHYLGALLTLKADALQALAQQHRLQGGPTQWATSEPVARSLQSAIDSVNERQSRVAHVRKYRVISTSLTIECGALTPTQKVRRQIVTQRYAALIDEIYQDES